MEKLKLLIIDDDPAILKSYSMLLRKDFDVDTSESVDDSIQKLKDYEYPVALVDMDFPDEPEGGLRICKKIKELGLLTKPIISTAFGELKTAKKAFDLGIERYLEKGDSIPKIEKTIAEAAEKFLHEKAPKEENENLKKTYEDLEIKFKILKETGKKEESMSSSSMIRDASAHAFEKCYNTPVRNMCYILRQFIHPHNDRARMITFAIQDYIDLWANYFSASTYADQNTYNKVSHGKQWIECFPLSDFKNDLNNFSRHIFNLRINNLYDDCYEGYQPNKGTISESDLDDKTFRFQDVWNGETKMTSDFFFQLDIQLGEDIHIFGIIPFFRVIMVNMLENAIEDLDLYKININMMEGKHHRPQISISACQSSDETSITFKNKGTGMGKQMLDRVRDEIFKKAKNNKLNSRDSNWAKDLKYRRNTTKSGTGTGRALTEAAYYFSRIVRISEDESEMGRNGWMDVKESQGDDYCTTEFTIHFPFGEKIIKDYKGKQENFSKPPEKVVYLWEEIWE